MRWPGEGTQALLKSHGDDGCLRIARVTALPRAFSSLGGRTPPRGAHPFAHCRARGRAELAVGAGRWPLLAQPGLRRRVSHAEENAVPLLHQVEECACASERQGRPSEYRSLHKTSVRQHAQKWCSLCGATHCLQNTLLARARHCTQAAQTGARAPVLLGVHSSASQCSVSLGLIQQNCCAPA